MSIVRMQKKEYWAHEGTKTYGGAVDQCKAEGGKLAKKFIYLNLL